MKRFFSVLLVVVLLFSLAVPAFATVPAVSALVTVGAENEPVVSAPAVGAVDEPIDEPVIGNVAAVAVKTKYVPIYNIDNFPPNTPINYTVDGVKHSAYYTSVFTSPNGDDWKLNWVLDGQVYSALTYYSVPDGASDFKTVFHFRYIPNINSYVFCFGYSYVNKENQLSLTPYPPNSGDPLNPFYKSNPIISIPTNAIFENLPLTPPDNPNPDLGGGDKTNGFVGEYGARILLPRNDFKQSKLNTIATKIYYKVPYNGVMGDVKLKVSGYIGDNQAVTYHKVQELSDKTVLEGYLDVAGAVTWNETKPITFTITDYNGKAYTCAVDVTCYDDFIDTDNDGLDDRTNQDEWTGNPDFNKPLPPDNSPPEGSNIIEWFKWFFNSIGEFFATLKSGFDSVISYGGDFSKFLGSAFSYLPSEISVVIGLGFTALVFLRIFGR